MGVSRPSTLPETRLCTPRIWLGVRALPRATVSTTVAVAGACIFLKIEGFGVTRWTRAARMPAMDSMVCVSSPSRARLKFTFWTNSVMPYCLPSKMPQPTVPDEGIPLAERSTRSRWTMFSGTRIVVPPFVSSPSTFTLFSSAIASEASSGERLVNRTACSSLCNQTLKMATLSTAAPRMAPIRIFWLKVKRAVTAFRLSSSCLIVSRQLLVAVGPPCA